MNHGVNLRCYNNYSRKPNRTRKEIDMEECEVEEEHSWEEVHSLYGTDAREK